MTAVEFAYWLQGMFELNPPTTLDERQTALIAKHLEMVFHPAATLVWKNEAQLTAQELAVAALRSKWGTPTAADVVAAASQFTVSC